MTDVVVFSEGGRTYRVMGLAAKAQAIRSAAQEVDGMLADRIRAANTALAEWRGRHSVTFAEDVNDVLSKMASFQVGLIHAANTLSSFPEAPSGGLGSARYIDSIYLDARVEVPAAAGTASAQPAALRAYGTTSSGQDERLPGLAAVVNLDGVTAEVTYHRDLTAAERQRRLDQGMPEDQVDRETVSQTDPVGDVARLIPLPNPQGDVPPLRAASQAVAEFATAVGLAFERADQQLLALLADYPDLAGFVVAGMGDGRVAGESSLAILMAYFTEFDANGDGLVSRSELEAARNRADLPEYARAAAGHLVANPVLFGLAETVGSRTDTLGRHGDGNISASDIRSFLELNVHVRTLEQNFDGFVGAHDHHQIDDRITREDLQELAAGTGPLAATAQFLLSNPAAFSRVANYEAAKKLGGYNHSGVISRNSVIGLVIDQQAYGDDPDAAREFVTGLPVPERGQQGIPIWLASDEGTRHLANTALIAAEGDLSDTHSVIAHLPETTGGVRNRLIIGFYDMLATRADAIFAGDLAGDPRAPGHPGANWAHFGVVASNGIRPVITGELDILGIPTDADRQAAADGNQWIFNDLGGGFANFIEMYERNPNPSERELEAFFSTNFGEGDAHTQKGFAAYVAAIEEPDPARRQRLLFEGNISMTSHEQAGIQGWLEEINTGPDGVAVSFVDFQVGDSVHHGDLDVPDANLANNHVDDANLLDMDPSGRTPADYRAGGPGATQFSVGGPSRDGVVDLAPISGIEGWDSEFPTSTRTWWEHGGDVQRPVVVGEHVVDETVHPSPDSPQGSGAESWTDRNERMYYILKLFEQHHTDPQLYRNDELELDMGHVEWLDPATGLR